MIQTLAEADDAGFKGKVAIVTGGGAAGDGIGNGRATCLLLAAAGAQVFVVDRDLGLAQRTVEMIAEAGGAGAAHAADVTDEGQCRDMVAAAVGQLGRVDFLVNNVGIGSRGSVVAEAPSEWQRVMQVNVETMFLASKAAIPEMIRTAQGGPSSTFPLFQPYGLAGSPLTRLPKGP